MAAYARAHRPQAETAANTASPDTASQIAAGASTRNGAAARAPISAPSRRSVSNTARGMVAAMTVTQTMALNASSTNYATPLVLDLDGNGVRTLSITAGVRFAQAPSSVFSGAEMIFATLPR